MYPDEGPPPRSCFTYMTIHPIPQQHIRHHEEIQSRCARKRTTEGDLDTDIDEDEERKEVQCAQPEHLFVLATVGAFALVAVRGLADLC